MSKLVNLKIYLLKCKLCCGIIELAIPLCKINGSLIAYKGPNYVDEIDLSKNALKQLDAVIDNSYLYSLPESQDKRSIIVVKKIKATKHRYPRNYSLIATKPL